MIFCFRIFLVITIFQNISFSQDYSVNISLLNELKKTKKNKIVKIHEDDFQSTFVLAIKEPITQHFHEKHTENIFVLFGKADMKLEKSTIRLRRGMHLTIPKGTIHSVEKIYGRKPLIVISVQSPKFFPPDRIFVQPKNK